MSVGTIEMRSLGGTVTPKNVDVAAHEFFYYVGLLVEGVLKDFVVRGVGEAAATPSKRVAVLRMPGSMWSLLRKMFVWTSGRW